MSVMSVGNAKRSFVANNDVSEVPDLSGADNDAVPPTFEIPADRITEKTGNNLEFNLGSLINMVQDGDVEKIVLEYDARVKNDQDVNNNDPLIIPSPMDL